MKKDNIKQIPGAICKHCGEILRNPSHYEPYITEWVEESHNSPFECIKCLREELQDLKDKISDLKSSQDHIENRIRRFD